MTCTPCLAALARAAAATLATLLVAPAVWAAPVISPFATDLAASAYSADSVGGGSAESAFNGGYWNAGRHGTHWIQADMGVAQTLSRVQFAIDVMPWTTTEQWVYLSDDSVISSGGHFNLVAHRSGYTSQYERFTLDFAPASGRYLLVVSNGGASWTAIGDGSPRQDWVDPGVGGNHVPEPGSLALVALALAAGAAARSRRVARI